MILVLLHNHYIFCLYYDLFIMKYITVHPLSLMETLVKMAPDSSKTTLRSWIKEGRITVNDSVATDSSLMVSPGQIVALGVKKCMIGGGIQIYYEDPHIVVIEKPSKLLSVATAAETEKTAQSYLRDRFKRVYAVHRLDRGTSGVMLFALTDEARHLLNDMFEKHDLQRCYTGIIEGKLNSSSGTWQSYLYEDDQYKVHSSASSERGVLAKTHYEVQSSSKKYSLIHFTLETGKKNQIRVHCQEAQHPLAGDKKYGAISDPLNRLCLHAHMLAFQHPMTHKLLRFHSPAPSEFQKLTL